MSINIHGKFGSLLPAYHVERMLLIREISMHYQLLIYSTNMNHSYCIVCYLALPTCCKTEYAINFAQQTFRSKNNVLHINLCFNDNEIPIIPFHCIGSAETPLFFLDKRPYLHSILASNIIHVRRTIQGMCDTMSSWLKKSNLSRICTVLAERVDNREHHKRIETVY